LKKIEKELGIKIVPATLRHAQEIYPKMSLPDEKEFFLKNNINIKKIMIETVLNSKESYSVFYNNELLAIFGLHDNKHEGKTLAWAAPDAYSKYKLKILKVGREIIKEMTKIHGELCSLASCDHPFGIRWLQLLGGKLEEKGIVLNGIDYKLITYKGG
jgi:hypothetical protein